MKYRFVFLGGKARRQQEARTARGCPVGRVLRPDVLVLRRPSRRREGSFSAGAGAGVGDLSVTLGEDSDAAGCGDRDVCAGWPTGLAVSAERVPGPASD